jgi:hypothetical protein
MIGLHVQTEDAVHFEAISTYFDVKSDKGR